MYFQLVSTFLSSSVLFFEPNLLDAELGIQNYKFRRSGLTNGEVYRQLNEGAHLKTFFLWNSTARTGLLLTKQGTVGLYDCFCSASTNNCVKLIIWSNAGQLSFLLRNVFVPGVCEPNNFNFSSREFLPRK